MVPESSIFSTTIRNKRHLQSNRLTGVANLSNPTKGRGAHLELPLLVPRYVGDPALNAVLIKYWPTSEVLPDVLLRQYSC